MRERRRARKLGMKGVGSRKGSIEVFRAGA
jgi:hypothetical protein